MLLSVLWSGFIIRTADKTRVKTTSGNLKEGLYLHSFALFYLYSFSSLLYLRFFLLLNMVQMQKRKKNVAVGEESVVDTEEQNRASDLFSKSSIPVLIKSIPLNRRNIPRG